jgi:DNA ligase-1
VRTLFATHSDTLSFILDAEIVAIDPRDGALRTFQELSNRARKAVNATSIGTPLHMRALRVLSVQA